MLLVLGFSLVCGWTVLIVFPKCGSKIPLLQKPLFNLVQEEIYQGKPRDFYGSLQRDKSGFRSAVFRKIEGV